MDHAASGTLAPLATTHPEVLHKVYGFEDRYLMGLITVPAGSAVVASTNLPVAAGRDDARVSGGTANRLTGAARQRLRRATRLVEEASRLAAGSACRQWVSNEAREFLRARWEGVGATGAVRAARRDGAQIGRGTGYPLQFPLRSVQKGEGIEKPMAVGVEGRPVEILGR
jgi:hypothetical protein